MRKKKNSPTNRPGTTKTGTLYIVATPIGNLEDITLRGIRILKEVDLIAAEDTRHTRKLLSHLGISTPMISYFKDKEASRADLLIKKLLMGINIALVSDAGTPGISDPGHIVVQQARETGIGIVPIPGPSSMTAALSVSGRPNSPLLFLGFLPNRSTERRKLLKTLAQEERQLQFFESPRRLKGCLKDCLEILGDRQAFWARELTKIHETLKTGRLSELLETATTREPKGESVLIIDGAEHQEASSGDLTELLRLHHRKGDTLKDAVQKISKNMGWPRTRVYKEALRIWQARD